MPSAPQAGYNELYTNAHKLDILKALTIFVFIICAAVSHAQPEIEWQNTIGGSASDFLVSVNQTNDGGYILGGYSNSDISGDKDEDSQGNFDYWVVKLDPLGVIEWQNTIGGDSTDVLGSIDQTTDGGYILGGSSYSGISGDKTDSSRGGDDFWVVKLDQLGGIEWQKTIGGNGLDWVYVIQQTIDKGYIVGGKSDSDISGEKTDSTRGMDDYWVVKLDSSGVIEWQNTIGGNSLDRLYAMQQTDDQGYILGGESLSDSSGEKTENNLGGSDYWIVKLDANGVIQWENTIGGSQGDVLRTLQQTNDNGFILGGSSNSNISWDKDEDNQGGGDMWVVKTDSVGGILWQNTIGGNAGDGLNSIQQISDGSYVLGGTSESGLSGDKTEDNIGWSDYWVIKLDSSGIIQWQETIGGSSIDELTVIEQTSDHGYILGGYSASDTSGDKTENGMGSWDFWILKMGADTTTFLENEILVPNPDLQIYPNPTSGQLTIEMNCHELADIQISITNILGQILDYKSLSSKQTNTKVLDLTELRDGIYFIQVISQEKVYCEPVIIEH